MIFIWHRCIDLTINNFFLCPYSPSLHELHPTGRLYLSSTLQYLSFPPSFSMTFFVAVLLRLRRQPLFYARRYLETSLTSSTENWSELSWWWLNLLGKPSLRKPGKQKCFRPKARAEFVSATYQCFPRGWTLKHLRPRQGFHNNVSKFSEVFNNTKNTVSTVHSLQFTAVRCLWISGLPSLVFNLNMSFSLFMLARFIESQQRLTRDLRMINGKFRRRIRPVTETSFHIFVCHAQTIRSLEFLYASSLLCGFMTKECWK